MGWFGAKFFMFWYHFLWIGTWIVIWKVKTTILNLSLPHFVSGKHPQFEWKTTIIWPNQLIIKGTENESELRTAYAIFSLVLLFCLLEGKSGGKTSQFCWSRLMAHLKCVIFWNSNVWFELDWGTLSNKESLKLVWRHNYT